MKISHFSPPGALERGTVTGPYCTAYIIGQQKLSDSNPSPPIWRVLAGNAVGGILEATV